MLRIGRRTSRSSWRPWRTIWETDRRCGSSGGTPGTHDFTARCLNVCSVLTLTICAVRAERYLRAVISSAVPNTLRRDAPELRPALSATSGTNTLPLGGSPRPAPVSSAISTEGEGSSKHSTYHGTIETYMYRNNCCLRLGLPHRSVPLVQVDLYGLQEILAVRTVSTSVSHTAAGPHAPVSIPSGVSPITYMNLFNKPTVLAPTATTHAAAALDIYAVMRLAPARGAHSAYSTTGASTPFPYGLPNRSGANSGTSSPIVRGGFSGPLTAKNCPVGAVVTAVHKAEARRTPLEQSDPTAGTIGGAGPSAVVLPNAWYKQQQPAIARAVEYNWRDQALFRFALPEGQLYTHLPANTPTVGIHPYPEAAADSAAGVFPPTVLSVPPCYFETLSVLVIAVYERTFFADTLLGELELELAPLNTKRYVLYNNPTCLSPGSLCHDSNSIVMGTDLRLVPCLLCRALTCNTTCPYCAPSQDCPGMVPADPGPQHLVAGVSAGAPKDAGRVHRAC